MVKKRIYSLGTHVNFEAYYDHGIVILGRTHAWAQTL